MAVLAESGATLVISGAGLDLGAVSRRLGIPTGVGDTKLTTLPDGRRLSVEPGRWALRAPTSRPGDPDGQISALLTSVNGDPGVWRDLTAQYSLVLQATLYLDEPTEETVLAPETLALMAIRGIALRFEIYTPFIAAGSCGG